MNGASKVQACCQHDASDHRRPPETATNGPNIPGGLTEHSLRDAVAELIDQHLTARDISTLLGIHQRQVHHVLETLRERFGSVSERGANPEETQSVNGNVPEGFRP